VTWAEVVSEWTMEQFDLLLSHMLADIAFRERMDAEQESERESPKAGMIPLDAFAPFARAAGQIKQIKASG
jgi:hypothetical protein